MMFKIVLMVALVAWTSHAQAADNLSGAQIMERATQNNAFGFANAVAIVTLTLTKKDGGKRTRQIEIRSAAREGAQRTLVRFLTPAEVSGTAFLVLENKGGEDEQYLYLPALSKTKRITGKQRDDKFMGTDLTYADIQAKDVRSGDFERLKDGMLGEVATYVVTTRLPPEQNSAYSRTVTHVHQTAFVPLKIEFFAADGTPQKVLEVQRLEKKEGHWIAMDSHITDSQTGSSTHMHVDRISFAQTLSDADFSQRALAGG